MKYLSQLVPFVGGLFLLTLIACQIQANNKATLQETNSDRPNIIYILVDDMGYGDLGCYGQKEIPTPNLDRMAAQGIRFTQHYAGSTVCAPSRSALITGMHTGHGRVRGNYETGPFGFGGELELRSEDVTVSEVLHRSGYHTAMIGKWGLGMNGTTGEPSKKGFDYYYGFLNQAHAHWQYPEYLFRNGDTINIPQNQDAKRGAYSNDLFTEEALQFIEQKEDEPFFLYLAYTTPHAELLVPEDSIYQALAQQYDDPPYVATKQGGDKSGFGKYASQAHPKAAYASMVIHIDQDVQRILDLLAAKGLDKNTVVMFSSDNGPHQEGGAHPTQFDSNGPLRGMKRDLYEGGIRVPMIVSWPGTIEAGQESDHISAFWDVLPTIADIAQIDIGNLEVDGISFMPTLLGRAERQNQHPYLYWEFHEAKYSHQAVRQGNWKAVRLDPAAKAELYDINSDPSETQNLADTHPEVLQKLTRMMEQTRSPHPIWPIKNSEMEN